MLSQGLAPRCRAKDVLMKIVTGSDRLVPCAGWLAGSDSLVDRPNATAPIHQALEQTLRSGQV